MDDLESVAARFIELLVEHDARIEIGNRWLVGSAMSGEHNLYTVYYRSSYQKYSRVLYDGIHLLNAIEHLIGGEISDRDI